MANVGQATFVGSDVIIKCDKNWTCCQREQAQQKTKNLDDACQAGAPHPAKIKKKVLERTSKVKRRCQKRETARFIREMKSDPKKGAADNATSPCLAEQITRDWNKGDQATSKLGVEMDHRQEVKYSGPANATLKALDLEVNGFFGNIVAKNVGDAMLKEGIDTPTSFSIVCKPPCKPPREADKNKDFSYGKKKAFPRKPTFVSPKTA